MANRFWVGGTAVWDNTTTANWSAATGGASGASVPGSADIAVFDGGSAAAVVTTNSSLNGITLGGITFTGTGNFTGTLNLSGTTGFTVSGSFSISGSGTRTVTLGTGTFTLTGTNSSVWDASTVTGLTFTPNTASLLLIGNPINNINFISGSLTYGGTVTIGNPTPPSGAGSPFQLTGSPSIANLVINAGCSVFFTANHTITSSFTASGTSAANCILMISNTTQRVITLPASGVTMSWCAIGNLSFTNTPTANNSFNLLTTTGITINAPAGGGGVISPIGS